MVVVMGASLPCGRRDGGYPPLWSAGHRLYPPPLRKHGQGQKNNGHTGSPCLHKPVLAQGGGGYILWEAALMHVPLDSICMESC